MHKLRLFYPSHYAVGELRSFIECFLTLWFWLLATLSGWLISWQLGSIGEAVTICALFSLCGSLLMGLTKR